MLVLQRPVILPQPTLSAAFNDAGITHGFFGRRGGVSEGIYASLNAALRNGDDPRAVRINRAYITSALGLEPEHLYSLQQGDTGKVVQVQDDIWSINARPVADAMVTNRPGRGLGILTADCAPVLFAAKNAPVIGAAHAGRKNALSAVLEFTVIAMEDLGAKRGDITAVIGPAIGPQSYEIEEKDGHALYREDPVAGNFLEPNRDGHLLMDLPGYCQHRLHRIGVTDVHVIAHDTAALRDDYFSYRRSTLMGTQQGMQMSVIALKPRI